jgi:hypothetical protein
MQAAMGDGRAGRTEAEANRRQPERHNGCAT